MQMEACQLVKHQKVWSDYYVRTIRGRAFLKHICLNLILTVSRHLKHIYFEQALEFKKIG